MVCHEFAHKLDMLDGAADGTPPLVGRDQLAEWVAECFAVATEEFFDRPRALLKHGPDLYRVLNAYYRQDPAGRAKRNCHRGSQ